MALATVTVTGTPDNPIFNFDIPQGEKGEPGGFVAGTDLSTIHLNTILVAGIYRQGNGVNCTTALGYPTSNNATGTLTVLTPLPNNVVQEWQYALGSQGRRVFWRRYTTDSGANWSSWASYNSSRTDNTAGRAIYTWDESVGREQLIYGDTGIRRVETDFKNGWVANIASLRRNNNTVSLGIYNANPAAQTSATAYTLPLGFRPGSYGGNLGFPIRSASLAGDWMQVTTAGDVNLSTTNGIVGSGYIVHFTFTTADAWPTVLPGTASGSIPNL